MSMVVSQWWSSGGAVDDFVLRIRVTQILSWGEELLHTHARERAG